jgi:hypothetical protein
MVMTVVMTGILRKLFHGGGVAVNFPALDVDPTPDRFNDAAED